MSSVLDRYAAKLGIPVPPPPLVSTPEKSDSSNYDEYINRHAAAQKIDPDLVRAVMSKESRGHKTAVSPKGARGLMQLMPATAARFGVTDSNDPDQNIAGGTKYLRFLLDHFKGNVDLALAGYNAGEGAVEKYGGVPPYEETQNYVKDIRGKYKGAGYAQSQSGASPASQTSQTQTSTPPSTPTIDKYLKRIGRDVAATPTAPTVPQSQTPAVAAQPAQQQSSADATPTRGHLDFGLPKLDIARPVYVQTGVPSFDNAPDFKPTYYETNPDTVRGSQGQTQTIARTQSPRAATQATTVSARAGGIVPAGGATTREGVVTSTIQSLAASRLKNPEAIRQFTEKWANNLRAAGALDLFVEENGKRRRATDKEFAQYVAGALPDDAAHGIQSNPAMLADLARWEQVEQHPPDSAEATPQGINPATGRPFPVTDPFGSEGWQGAEVLPRERSLSERASQFVSPYVERYAPGLAALNTQEGIKTTGAEQFARSAVREATLGLVRPGDVDPSRIHNERERELVEMSGRAGGLVGVAAPFAAAGKLIQAARLIPGIGSLLAELEAAGPIGQAIVRGGQGAATFGGMQAVREAGDVAHGTSQGAQQAFKNIGRETALGGLSMGLTRPGAGALESAGVFGGTAASLDAATGVPQGEGGLTGNARVDSALRNIATALAFHAFGEGGTPEQREAVKAYQEALAANRAARPDGQAVSLSDKPGLDFSTDRTPGSSEHYISTQDRGGVSSPGEPARASVSAKPLGIENAPTTASAAPAPESSETLAAQFRSASDSISPRVAVLVTEGERAPEAPEGFEPVEIEGEGTLYVNTQKAAARGWRSAADIQQVARERGVASLTGRIAEVADTTTGNALRTEDARGRELNSSIVPPGTESAQAALDLASHPEAARQELLPAQEAVARRQAETTGAPAGAAKEALTPEEIYHGRFGRVRESQDQRTATNSRVNVVGDNIKTKTGIYVRRDELFRAGDEVTPANASAAEHYLTDLQKSVTGYRQEFASHDQAYTRAKRAGNFEEARAASTARESARKEGVAAEERLNKLREEVRRARAAPTVAAARQNATSKVTPEAKQDTSPTVPPWRDPARVEPKYVPPSEIEADTSLQYKRKQTTDTGASGTFTTKDGKVKEGVKYDPSIGRPMLVWRDPASGKLKIVNGFNRLDLANQTDAPRVKVQEIEAADAKEARLIGALDNFIENRGTAQDAADLFKEFGIKSEQDIARFHLPVTATVREGLKINEAGAASVSGKGSQVLESARVGAEAAPNKPQELIEGAPAAKLPKGQRGAYGHFINSLFHYSESGSKSGDSFFEDPTVKSALGLNKSAKPQEAKRALAVEFQPRDERGRFEPSASVVSPTALKDWMRAKEADGHQFSPAAWAAVDRARAHLGEKNYAEARRLVESRIKQIRERDQTPKENPSLEDYYKTAEDDSAHFYRGSTFVIAKQKGLSPEQHRFEARAAHDLNERPLDFVEDYVRKYMNPEGQLLINTDEARESFTGYGESPEARARHAASVHEPAAALSAVIWDGMLDRAARGDVLMMAGAGGSGKSSAIERVPEVQALADAAEYTFDGTLANRDKAVQRVEQVLASGRRARIVFVMADPYFAARLATSRAMPKDTGEGGRTVPYAQLGKNHFHAPYSFLGLAEKYADDARVDFLVIENRQGAEPRRIPFDGPEDLDALRQRVYNGYGTVESVTEAVRRGVTDQIGAMEAEGRAVPDFVKRGMLGDAGEDAYERRGSETEVQGRPRLETGDGQARGAHDGEPQPQATTSGRGGDRARAEQQREVPPPREPRVSPAVGRETAVDVPGRKDSYGARYTVRALEDIYPSHDPTSFKPNPEYQFENERRYDSMKHLQTQVEARSRLDSSDPFKPKYLLSNSPTLENGSPAIDEQGNVLGGNSRAMILSRVYKTDPDGGLGYKEALKSEAAHFGIKPEEIDRIPQPVLVREITKRRGTVAQAISDFNVESTTKLSSEERAASSARQLPPEAFNYIQKLMDQTGEDATISAMMDKHGAEVVNKLIDQGIWQGGERNALIDPKKGAATVEAKRRVERMMLARVLEDPKLLDIVSGTALGQKLERAVPPLVRTEGTDWDISEPLREAADLTIEYNNSKKGGIETLDQFLRTPSMVKSEPWSDDAIAIARVLDASGPVGVGRAFKAYAGDKAMADSGGGLFGGTGPRESFEQHFGEKGAREPSFTENLPVDKSDSSINNRTGRATSKAESQAGQTDEAERDRKTTLAEGESQSAPRRIIQGLELYTKDEILGFVRDHIEESINRRFIPEIKIKGIALYGSRVQGTAKKSSDLDVVFEYEGDWNEAREDGLFNALNDDADNRLTIDGIKVDINPIRADNSGTLKDWLAQHGNGVTLEERTPLTQTERATLGNMRKQAMRVSGSIDTLAADSQIDIRGSRVYMNAQALDVLRTALGETNTPVGRTLTSGQINRALESLSDYTNAYASRKTGKLPTTLDGLERMQRALLSARRASEHGAVEVVERPGEFRTLKETVGTARHENLHKGQIELARGRSIDEHVDHARFFTSAENAAAANRARLKLVMDFGYAGRSDGHLAAEVSAWINGGKWEQLGLTYEEARGVALDYFELLAEQHGAQSLDVFEHLHPMLKEVRDEVRQGKEAAPAETGAARDTSGVGRPIDTEGGAGGLRSGPRPEDGSVRPREGGTEVRRGAGAPQAAQKVTETPEFKKWFGDSKVRGENGEPLVMYHVTDADFTEFKPSWRGLIFLAKTPEGAQRSAAVGKNSTMAVYVRAEKIKGSPRMGIYFGDVENARFRERLKAEGYDAVYVRDESGTSLAVLDPKQIKSATGNRGTFDPTDANILAENQPPLIETGREFDTEERERTATYSHAAGAGEGRGATPEELRAGRQFSHEQTEGGQASEEAVRAELDRLNKQEKENPALRFAVKWRRAMLLSSVRTLGKLGGAAMWRGVSTPVEEVFGAALSKAMPRLAAKAEREGGFSAKAEAAALRQFVERATYSDAWQKLTTGKSSLDLLYGEGATTQKPLLDVKPEAEAPLLDFFGRLHGAFKMPAQRAEFFRAFEKRAEARAARGEDIADPQVQLAIGAEAYGDSQRAILMQDNIASDAYKFVLNYLERRGPAGKLLATGGRVLFPIVKVPTNYAIESSSYLPGVGAAKGLGRVLLSKGINDLTPEQADYVMRAFKKQGVGLALTALGYFGAGSIGGYYQRGERRKEGDTEAGDITIFGLHVSHRFLHAPFIEALQFGATLRRVSDGLNGKKPEGLGEGLYAAGTGLLKQVPFVDEPLRVAQAMEDSASAGRFAGELVKSAVVPPDVQALAKYTDKDASGETAHRRPHGFVETIEEGVPGLRKKVPYAENDWFTSDKKPDDPVRAELQKFGLNLAKPKARRGESERELEARAAREAPLMYNALNMLRRTSGYQQLPDGNAEDETGKAGALKGLERYVRSDFGELKEPDIAYNVSVQAEIETRQARVRADERFKALPEDERKAVLTYIAEKIGEVKLKTKDERRTREQATDKLKGRLTSVDDHLENKLVKAMGRVRARQSKSNLPAPPP